MEETKPQKKVIFRPPPNPVHLHQITWQIYVPLGVTIFLVIFLALLLLISASKSVADLATMANVSVIILVIQGLLVGIPILALLVGSIYGLAKLLPLIPIYSMITRSYVYLASLYIIQGLNYSVEPIFFVRSYTASAKKFGKMLVPSRKKI